MAPLAVPEVPLRISCYSEALVWPAAIHTTWGSFFLGASTLKKKATQRCRRDPIFCCHVRLPIDCEKANNTAWAAQAFRHLNPRHLAVSKETLWEAFGVGPVLHDPTKCARLSRVRGGCLSLAALANAASSGSPSSVPGLSAAGPILVLCAV